MGTSQPFNWAIPNLNKSKCSAQIEDFCIRNIKSKKLIPNDPLPSYRVLAQINGISESSVKRAYTRLMNSNWVMANPGSGTFVSLTNPITEMPHRTSGFTDRFPLSLRIRSKTIDQEPEIYKERPFIRVGTDFPSPSSFPEEKFAEYCNAHTLSSKYLSQTELFKAYHASYLKDAVLNILNRKRNFGLKADMMEIIKGREVCLEMVLKLLVNPSELVINTSSYDTKLNQLLHRQQAQVMTIPRSDENFMQRIAEALQNNKVKLIYVQPQCSFPEGHTLSKQDCLQLVELAKTYKVCLLEEEEDHEFWYGESPYSPLASYDHDGFVIYLGAISKATPATRNLRIVVACTQFIDELNLLPQQPIEDRNMIEEKAIADMLVKGDLAAYAKQIRLKSKTYRNELKVILEMYLQKFITYELPDHGLTFWLKFDKHLDLNTVLSKLDKSGIPIPYHPDNHKTKLKVNYMLLGFGAFDLKEAESGAKMMGKVIEGL